jgi:hypothetical protein
MDFAERNLNCISVSETILLQTWCKVRYANKLKFSSNIKKPQCLAIQALRQLLIRAAIIQPYTPPLSTLAGLTDSIASRICVATSPIPAGE